MFRAGASLPAASLTAALRYCVALIVGLRVALDFAPLASLLRAPSEVPLPPSERGFALLALTLLVVAHFLLVLRLLAPSEVRARALSGLPAALLVLVLRLVPLATPTAPVVASARRSHCCSPP